MEKNDNNEMIVEFDSTVNTHTPYKVKASIASYGSEDDQNLLQRQKNY